MGHLSLKSVQSWRGLSKSQLKLGCQNVRLQAIMSSVILRFLACSPPGLSRTSGSFSLMNTSQAQNCSVRLDPWLIDPCCVAVCLGCGFFSLPASLVCYNNTLSLCETWIFQYSWLCCCAHPLRTEPHLEARAIILDPSHQTHHTLLVKGTGFPIRLNLQ